MCDPPKTVIDMWLPSPCAAVSLAVTGLQIDTPRLVGFAQAFRLILGYSRALEDLGVDQGGSYILPFAHRSIPFGAKTFFYVFTNFFFVKRVLTFVIIS